MNAKHLFLTLVAAVSCATYVSADKTTATDVISVSTISAKGYSIADEGYNSVSGWTFESGATYAASRFYYSSGDDYIGAEKPTVIATTASVSGRKVKSITIVWEDGITDLNDEGGTNSTIEVGARNGTPYTGNETSLTGSYCHTFEYNDGVTTYNFTSDYEYVTLFCDGVYGAFVKSISIVWEWEVYTYYTIGEGSITDGVWGTNVIASTTSAKAGDEVTITFVPQKTGSGPKQKKYSLTSYGFDDMVFDLSCTTYPTNPNTYEVKFIMPARNVDIDATFEIITFTTTYVKIDESVTSVQSGVETVIPFTHLDKSGNPIADYTASYISATSSDESVIKVDAPVKVSEGNYTFTVHGLAMGSATVTIDAAAKGTANSATNDITFTVTPREVVLLAERSGSYYVMENTLDGSTANAHEVVYNTTDSKYYYASGLSLSTVTWNATTVTEGEYAVQNPSSDEFLKFDKGNLTMSASTYSWWKNGEDKFISPIGSYGISYNGSKFLAAVDLTNAAIEALIGSNFIPFGSYSTVSGAVINDVRSLTEGGYGTFCSPYDVPDVSTAGAKFYSLTGKVLNGDKTQLAGIVLSEDPETELVAGHSYFYQVDAGSSAINLTGCMNHVTHAWENGADGFVGCLVDDNGGKTYVPNGVERINGNYILQSGKLRYVAAGTTASIRAYRAYINVGELEDVDAKSVPKRRIVRAEGFEGELGMEDTATGIDELAENSVINWNEPVYNIMGMRVGKGATGVLIQNGRKFFVK